MIPQLYAVKEITRADPKLLWLYALRTLSLCLLGPWFLVAMLPLYFKSRTHRRHRLARDDDAIPRR